MSVSKTLAIAAVALLSAGSIVCAQGLKEETRSLWSRNDTNFIRQWDVAGPFACDLARDCLADQGGEARAAPKVGTVTWLPQKAWAEANGFDALGAASREGAVGYATAVVTRAAAGKALLSVGSVDGVRVWVNGKLALAKDGRRSLTLDEDQVEVELAQGANRILVKTSATGAFAVRVLETGAVLTRIAEIGPSIIEMQPEMFTVRTDVSGTRAAAEPVKVEVIAAGGAVKFTRTAKRGELVVVDAKGWPDGPYEARASTRTHRGLLFVTHLPWYKGDALAKARELAAEAARVDASTPAGFTLKMLAEMVDDRLGVKLADAKGNPWPKIHSPLMEYDEILLERGGNAAARVRAGGFMRIAYRDEVDGSPQFARAYLPPSYDPAKKWPLVLHIHGFNPANPVYWRWWSADARHPGIDSEFPGNQQVIYIEPHGRGNTQYRGMGDTDVVRVIAEAKRTFAVDEDRVYLSGDSMGGWGTWNVATRHADLFAAIAPVFGGVDYHSTQTEEQLARLTPVDRYILERESSWGLADSLVNTPILVHHGDRDAAVNVEWTRYGVKLLQRWGFDVQYREYPGREHETLVTAVNNNNLSIPWFLQHRRDPNPAQVRIRTGELRHARAYWVEVLQGESPLDHMVVDAEVVDRNVLRVDTRNVLDLVLTPRAPLLDPAQPVKVVWNGVAREMRVQEGALRLTDAAYRPAALRKSSKLPGGFNDFNVTPFAVVIGTTAKDAAMRQLLRERADAFTSQWADWQKQPARVFEDTKMSDADVARYSLLLLGGPAENAVTAKLAARLPLRLGAGRITIDGGVFEAPDASVQLIYPNPRNAERYVWLVAANSVNGMRLANVSPYNATAWDYVIEDGHLPGPEQQATAAQVGVVTGMFDRNWRYAKEYAVAGNAELRAQARRIRFAPAVPVTPAALDAYAGKYRLGNGNVVEITRKGERLVASGGPGSDELLTQDERNFYSLKFRVWLAFERDAGGKVTGFKGFDGGTFEGTKE